MGSIFAFVIFSGFKWSLRTSTASFQQCDIAGSADKSQSLTLRKSLTSS